MPLTYNISYTDICIAIGLENLASPGLEVSTEAEVPWALPLQRLFQEKPAAHNEVLAVGEDEVIIHPRPDPTAEESTDNIRRSAAPPDLEHNQEGIPFNPRKRTRAQALDPDHLLEAIQSGTEREESIWPGMLSGDLVFTSGQQERYSFRHGWNFNLLQGTEIAGDQVFTSGDLPKELTLRDNWRQTVLCQK